MLIKAGANVNQKDGLDNTALIEATFQGHKEIVKLLINTGADINAKDALGNTALIKAVMGGYKEIVEVLITADADVNATNDFGNTGLIVAAYNGRQEIAEILIKAGTDANMKDDNGNTALYYLNEDKYPETAALLKDAMAHPEKCKPVSEEEKAQIVQQVKAMSAQQMKDLPKYNPKLLGQLCIVNGLMETTFSQLDYSQQKALYAGTYKDVSPVVRVAMENILKNNGK